MHGVSSGRGWLLDMKISCKYIEQTVVDNRQQVTTSLGIGRASISALSVKRSRMLQNIATVIAQQAAFDSFIDLCVIYL
jgi:hypothetical protein